MLSDEDYFAEFFRLQAFCLDVTRTVAHAAVPGASERQLADIYHDELHRHGITDFWYPTLICAGKYSGQPLTRRNHLPDAGVKLRENDIVILDVTPMKKTVWGNWTVTKSMDNDSFYRKLCDDVFTVALTTAVEVLRGDYAGLKEIHASCLLKAKALDLDSIDPRGNVGHSIFQVPAGQTVDETPLDQRLFIDASDQPVTEPVLLSIEPELARINPADGVRYGGKFQFIVPFGYGDGGKQLIKTQYAFYRAMAAQEGNETMMSVLNATEPVVLEIPSGRKTSRLF